MKRISEIITPNEIKTWKNTDIITISAGTGRGKSHFIKNILYAFAEKNNKKILMLIHRVNCVDQFRKEIMRDNKTHVIDIKSYQSLENGNGKFIDFADYEYIVCDEFHYFLSDAAFNITTDISLDMILSKTNITRILMSATGDYMKRYINNIKRLDTRDYELPQDFSFIEQLTFYNKDDTLEKFIEQAIKQNDKGIFFIQSVEKAFGLYNKYKEYCLFNCSKTNGYYKHVDKERISNMLESEKFNENILITTTCMDAGVNINDIDVKHIVLDVKDTGVLIQCLGRRRIQNEEDKIHIYIKNINNRQLGGMETQLKQKIKKADFLLEHTVKEYIQKYPRSNDYSNIVYDEIVNEDNKATKRINELMYYKCKFDLGDIAEMKLFGEYGYCKYLQNIFKYNRLYRLISEDHKKDELERYLESTAGDIMPTLKDRKELIEKIDVKSNGRRLKKINNLNGALEEMEISFRIVEFETSRTVGGKKKKFKNAWKVEKLIS